MRLASTVLGGRFTLRTCIVNHRSTGVDIDLVAGLVERISGEPLRPAPEIGT